MRIVIAALSFLALASCARKPLSPEVQQGFDRVAAASFLGDQFIVDVTSRALIRPRERALDVSLWKVDETFRDLIRAEVQDRARTFVPFTLDSKAVEKALSARESRWKKTLGPQSQALMELLFQSAEKAGIRYFFLLTPLSEHERYPLHRGAMGAYCNDKDLKEARAYVYFFFDFSFWDVAARKKVFTTLVDPGVTEMMTFGGCTTAADLSEPVKQLEDPVKKTMGLLVNAVFDKLGWEHPAHR